MGGVELSVTLKGDNLPELKEWAFPNLTLPFIVPSSDSYTVSFDLRGGLEQWRLSNFNGELAVDENKVILASNTHPFFTLDEVHLNIETAGKDLLRFVSLLGLSDLVSDDIGASGIQHDMKFAVDGLLNALNMTDLNAKLIYKDNDIKLMGDIADLNNMLDINLDFDISGSERELASLIGNNNFTDVFLHATGSFVGSLSEFSLRDFFYQGDRGFSSGKVYVDINGKPAFKAQLGDTKLFFESQEVDKPESKKLDKDEAISFAWMDNLDIDVIYDSLFIIRNKAEIEILGGKILMKDGFLNWDPLKLNYKNKSVEASLFINAGKDEIRFAANARQIDFGSLLKDLDWFTRFVGLADIDFNLESKGLSDKELIANLKGKGKIIFRNGKVTDFGSASMSYVQALTPWRKSVADLELECFLTTIDVKQGILNFDHLFMENKEMYLTGGGKVNLNSYTMDLAISPRAKNKNFFDANVSLFAKGPLDNPKVQVGKLSAISDVGLKYGQWALLGPLSLALPKLKIGQTPSCERAIQNL